MFENRFKIVIFKDQLKVTISENSNLKKFYFMKMEFKIYYN